MDDGRAPVTERELDALLASWRSGDADACDALYRQIYPELTALARSSLNRYQRGASLHTGDLLHNAFLRVFRRPPNEIQDKEHLLALSAQAMKHVLLDQYRRNNRIKRHGLRVELDEQLHDAPLGAIDVTRLEQALIRLRLIDPKWAQLVEMRYFGGMTNEECSKVLDWSLSKVKRTWPAILGWMMEALSDDA